MRSAARAVCLAPLLILSMWHADKSLAAIPDASGGEADDPVIVVVDTSGSMGDDDGTGRVKIEGAKIALLDFLKGVEPGTPIGLRTYPDNAGDDCNVGRRRFAVEPRNPGAMAAEIRTLTADGDTPTAEAMGAAVQDLKDAGYQRGSMVLVSDGESTCRPPCDEAKKIAESGIALQTITVGFRISDEGKKELKCIADAMDGRYVDADENKGLAQVFADISRPRLEVSLSYPRKAAVEVGNDARGLVRVFATVRNSGGRQARDVSARLRFDEGAPGVARPIRALGNLDPGASRTVDWAFRPGVLLSGTSVRFTTLFRADNGLTDARAGGEVAIVDQTDPRFAGEILKRPGKLAVLGDSYSAGEGAGAYLPGTDTKRNACHKSRKTYLVSIDAFGIPDSNIIACSGGVIADVQGGNDRNKVDSQVAQLQRAGRSDPKGVSGVVMTLGGNDAGFREVALACLFPGNCEEEISGQPTDRFVADRLGEDEEQESLVSRLVSSYAAINQALNAPAQVSRRGGIAPLLVLAYPIPVPQPKRARGCNTLLATTPGEVSFILRFVTRLNALVEGAVSQSRANGVPVSFVPSTEDAFLPDHTVCDREPYARGLSSVRPAGVDWLEAFRDGVTDAAYPAGVKLRGRTARDAWDLFSRTGQQLAHPNVQGYAAMTRAIIRWSQSGPATQALEFLDEAEPADDPSIIAPFRASDVDLGQLAPGQTPTLQGGTSYALTTDGFMPGSPVTVTVRSQVQQLAEMPAGPSGGVSTRIALPRDVEGGSHVVEVSGVDPEGQSRVVRIPVKVTQPPRPAFLLFLLLGAGTAYVLAVLAWVLAAIRGRRERNKAPSPSKPRPSAA